jgi:hypothetical protein|tara:strand:- start:648 stop:872 length:225 start_codon:yes stop_codon:yes gene_type:complete
MTTRFIPNPPPMMYLDGKAVEAEIAIRIFDGSIETTVNGFCSETGMNVLDLGDAMVLVHSVFIDSYDSYKLSNG